MYRDLKSVGIWYKYIQLYNSFSAVHVIMLDLKNNKHNTSYHYTYLYIVNAVIFKLLLTFYLKRDLDKNNNNNNVTTLICLAISVRSKVLRNPQYSRGLN